MNVTLKKVNNVYDIYDHEDRFIGVVWKHLSSNGGRYWRGSHESGTGFVSDWCSTRQEAVAAIVAIEEGLDADRDCKVESVGSVTNGKVTWYVLPEDISALTGKTCKLVFRIADGANEGHVLTLDRCVPRDSRPGWSGVEGKRRYSATFEYFVADEDVIELVELES